MGGNSGIFGGGGPSSGGVSGPQTSFAKWTRDEQTINNAQQFGASGMGGAATGLTQADAGANAGEALQLMGMSDADAAALASLQTAQKASQVQNLGTIGGGLGSILGGL